VQNKQKYFLSLAILRIEKARNPCYNISTTKGKHPEQKKRKKENGKT
jgi:hypothetical protein